MDGPGWRQKATEAAVTRFRTGLEGLAGLHARRLAVAEAERRGRAAARPKISESQPQFATPLDNLGFPASKADYCGNLSTDIFDAPSRSASERGTQ